MEIKETELKGVYLISPQIHEDNRGYFYESFRSDYFNQNSLPIIFAQENQSLSSKGTLRGLHYQLNHPQGKLVSVTSGSVIDFAVDIRKGSPTFGKSICFTLDDVRHESLYIPEGFAHGFYVKSDVAIFNYKCTEVYHPNDEYGINWNDSDLNLDFIDNDPLVSEKDKSLPKLRDINNDLLPIYS
tara:strand:- start:1027 stop:1581 length:555 start_codon:yes stop_codon:yes gene_type:complete